MAYVSVKMIELLIPRQLRWVPVVSMAQVGNRGHRSSAAAQGSIGLLLPDQESLRDFFLWRRNLEKLTYFSEAEQSSQPNSSHHMCRILAVGEAQAVFCPMVGVTTIQVESSVPHRFLWRPQGCHQELSFLSITGKFSLNILNATFSKSLNNLRSTFYYIYNRNIYIYIYLILNKLQLFLVTYFRFNLENT